MASYIYKQPKPIGNPFRVGESVEILDSSGRVVGRDEVVYSGKRVVRLESGRRFRASDGYWIGQHGVYSFPTIRHSKRKVK